METFTSFFFTVIGALNVARYALWILYPLVTVVLLFAKFGKSPPDYALSNFIWWLSVVFLTVVGGLLVIGVAVASVDRYFFFPIFQMLLVAGPALLACLISAFLRPNPP